MEEWLTSLKTETPQQGFDPAVRLARKGVGLTRKYARNCARSTQKMQTVSQWHPR